MADNATRLDVKHLKVELPFLLRLCLQEVTQSRRPAPVKPHSTKAKPHKLIHTGQVIFIFRTESPSRDYIGFCAREETSGVARELRRGVFLTIDVKKPVLCLQMLTN